MDFDVTKSKVVPFSLPEQEIGTRFLCFLNEGESAPLDVTHKATILEIKRRLYPVRCFDVVFTAQWEARSIWEHTETYTEYQPKIVYIDWNGREHDEPGADYTDYTGKYTRVRMQSDAIKRPWRPMEKTVPVKKKRTMIDRVEDTFGQVPPSRSFQPIITYQKPEESFAKWIGRLVQEGQYEKYRPELVDGCDVDDLIESHAFAKKIAVSNAEDVALHKCRAQIPGNRYEDLHYSVDIRDCPMEIVLLPYYRIRYEYQGQEYACWLGGKAGSGFFYYKRPVDENLAAEKEQATEELRARKKERLVLGALICIVAPFISVVLMFTIGRFAFALFVIAEAVLIYKFVGVHDTIKAGRQALENRQSRLKEKRAAIAAIVRDPSTSEEEKRQRVQTILNQP